MMTKEREYWKEKGCSTRIQNILLNCQIHSLEYLVSLGYNEAFILITRLPYSGRQAWKEIATLAGWQVERRVSRLSSENLAEELRIRGWTCTPPNNGNSQ